MSEARASVHGMTRLIFDTAVSLNGWIADEGNSLDWLLSLEAPIDAEVALFPHADVLVEGSTTYEWVLGHEHLLAHPERWRALYGDRPTYVFTTRELPVPRGADVRLRSGSVLDVLDEIRVAAGEGDVWVVGGGDLAGQFLDAGVLDEIAVSIAPVLLTGGAPLLPRRRSADGLRLRSAQSVGPFARLVYEVIREATGGACRTSP